MADQEAEDKSKRQIDPKLDKAIEAISQTEDGVIFFRWLKFQCHFDRSTIVGNPQAHEVNQLGSIAQEFQRAIYLKVRRAFSRSAKIKIEIE